ncbi:voltage-dependent calcium channel gamma-5 subunit-like [Babylonia areolata]|uniref:voltage-dependent calcium channel gamma-5 subunit-like n=1 Tax=Babylonia areolata TaxID=304850 RepID=UPI003FD561A7
MCDNMKCSTYSLTFVSFAIASTSVAVLSLAVATDSWLHTREKLKFPSLPADEGNPFPINDTWVRVWAGMWRVCMETENLPEVSIECMEISYEAEGSRGENMTITSITIVSTARKSVALPVSALIVSVLGAIFTFMGNVRKDIGTLVGAVCYVLTGLALAVGMILYISAVNDEVGYRSSTMQEEGGFSYRYGWSFFTAGLAFLASEMAAVVGITLFLKRYERVEEMIRIIPGLEEKVDPCAALSPPPAEVQVRSAAQPCGGGGGGGGGGRHFVVAERNVAFTVPACPQERAEVFISGQPASQSSVVNDSGGGGGGGGAF